MIIRTSRTSLVPAPGGVAKCRVEPISWMQTCAAYAAGGFDVRLATLRIRRSDGIAAAETGDYGVAPNFPIDVA
jgi:hypothetical protein